MKISVSTLGCPTWSLSEILANCLQYGYGGIELRGIEGHLDITCSPYFATPAAIAATKRQFEDVGLAISAIDCSAQFASLRGIEQSRAEARAAIDLAQALGARFIRVFGGEASDGESRETGTERLVEELFVLGDYAYDRNVSVLLENHDAYVSGIQLAEVISRVRHSAVGALWDVHNSVVAGESLSASISALRPFLRFVHVKDSRSSDGAYCLLGEGDQPIRESVLKLVEHGYDGYISVEWEKLWQPNLIEPEVVFPQYAKRLMEYLGQAYLVRGT
jgi:sugar phosphate isomerase/epimerase